MKVQIQKFSFQKMCQFFVLKVLQQNYHNYYFDDYLNDTLNLIFDPRVTVFILSLRHKPTISN